MNQSLSTFSPHPHIGICSSSSCSYCQNNLFLLSKGTSLVITNKMTTVESPKKATARSRKLVVQEEKTSSKPTAQTRKISEEEKKSPMTKAPSYITQINSLSQKKVEDLLAKFEDAYYNDVPLISDQDFDSFVDIYETRFDRPYERVIAVPETDKFTLPYYLGSLDKIKTDKQLSNWSKKYLGQKEVHVVIMDKLDGMSSLLIVKNGQASLYTQGNHKVGRNISHLLPHIQIKIPKEDVEIRGELEIPKKDFEYQRTKELKSGNSKNKFDSARAMIAGIVNSKKTVDVEKARIVHFIAYRQFTPEVFKKSTQLRKIEKLGMRIPWNCTFNLANLSAKYLIQLVNDRKNDSDFEIDGVVLVIDQKIAYPSDNDPKHAVAFKAPTEEATTTILAVEWNASKYGQLKPRASISPVFLSGATLSWASCHDARNIVDLGINVGSVVVVTRSNDVIPYIKDVIVKKDPSLPPGKEGKDWEWDDNMTNIRLISKKKNNNDSDSDDMVIDGDDNEEEKSGFAEQIEIKKVYSFFKHLESKNLGEKSVAKLYRGGLNTIPKILNATIKDICEINGFQSRGAQNIIDGITKALADSTLLSIMVASGQLGMGLGTRKIEPILEKHPDLILNPLPTAKLIASIKEIEGFETKTATRFAKNLAAFINFLDTVPSIRDRLREESELSLVKLSLKDKKNSKNESKSDSDESIDETDEDESSGALCGKLICISGFRDKELIKHLTKMGAKETSSLSKKNAKKSILVVKKVGLSHGKELQAQDLEIPIMNLEDFLREYEIQEFLDKYGYDE